MKFDKLNIPDNSIRTIRNFGIDNAITDHAHERYGKNTDNGADLSAVIPDK